MGNCCQNENNRDTEYERYGQSIPAPIPQDSKKNSMIDPNFVKLNHKDSKSNLGQNHLINMNGVAQLQTNRNSFASTPQQRGSSPKEVGFLSNSKNNLTEYSSFISGLIPYKEKEITQRIQPQIQNLGDITGRSHFARESVILRSLMKNFYIITSIYTPIMSNQKVNLYRQFISKMESLGCRVVTIEFASLSSPFLVTEDNFQPYNFQIRLEDPIFLRLNIVNQVLKKLPDSWEWIGLIDYNIQFENDKWLENVQECLRSNRVVQLFEQCREIQQSDNTHIDKYGIVNFIQNINSNQPIDIARMQFYLEGGKAWAFRRDFYLDYYYFVDIFVTGFEEILFSLCLFGQSTQILQGYLNEDLLKIFLKLQQKYKNEINSQAFISGQIRSVILNQEKQQYNLLDAIALLNNQITNLYTDNQSMIHIRNTDHRDAKEELKFLNKVIL